MSAIFKKGDIVRQIVKPIQGAVVGFSVDQETGEVQNLVEYVENGETKSRYFGTSNLEAVEPVEPVEAVAAA